jgi:starch phosphorylase
VSADDFAAAKLLSAWRTEVLAAWPGVRVDHVDSQIDGDPELGGTLRLRAEVELAGLNADDVEVEAAFGTVDADDKLSAIETVALELAEKSDGRARFEGDVPLARTGSFGYTVRVLPKNALLASPAELGVSATA